jgi:hypothetical protein
MRAIQTFFENADNLDNLKRCTSIPTSNINDVTLPINPVTPKHTDNRTPNGEWLPTDSGKSHKTRIAIEASNVHHAQN